MERGRATEGNHGVGAEVLAVFDGVDAGGVGHVLVHDLGQPPCGFGRVHIQAVGEMGLQRRLGPIRIKRDGAAREMGWVELAQHKVRIRHRWPVAAAPVAGGAGFGACAFGAHTDLVQRIHMGERSAPCPDLDHVDHRNGNRHARALFKTIAAGHFEDAGGLGRLVLDQADLGGGPAHVEAQHLVQPMPRGDVGGEDRATGGARFHQPHGEIRRRVDVDDAAAGMHQEDGAIRAFFGQAALQAAQVGFHQRLDIGVGDGGVEAFVFPHLGRDLRGQRDHDARQSFRKNLGNHPFVGVVHVGMQQAHGDAFIPRLAQVVGQSLDLGPVQRDQRAAIGVQPFADGVAAIARQQRIGKLQVEIILFEPAFGAHLDHVAEAFGRDQRRLGPAPFDQRIGGQRGAVDHLRNRRGRDARLFTDPVHALDDRILGRGIGGQDLGGKPPLWPLQHQIGEGATDIGPQPV